MEHGLGLLLAVVFTAGQVACASTSTGKGAQPGADDPCKDVELAVEKVWSAGIKAEVLGHGGGVNAEQRQMVANNMDAVSEDWVRLRRSVCRDHFVRNLVSADEYRKQVRCFDDRLDEQRKLVTLLQGGQTDDAAVMAQKLVEAPDACQ